MVVAPVISGQLGALVVSAIETHDCGPSRAGECAWIGFWQVGHRVQYRSSVGANIMGALSKPGIWRIKVRTITGAARSVIQPPISVRRRSSARAHTCCSLR